MKVAVVGLGAMGMGIAKSSLRAGLDTVGYDVSEEKRLAFSKAGGVVAATSAKAAVNADCLAIVVVNQEQTEAVLFGENNASTVLPKGSVVLGCATVTSNYARDVSSRLSSMGLLYLDAPVSGGSIKAANGELSVMSSGSPDAYARARLFLNAIAENVFELGDEAGIGSTMKMINQLLVGVHIATAMEAVALGIKSGIDIETLFEVITLSAGNSWIFEDRVPHVLNNDYAPKSAVDIFVKDLGIVLDAGKRQGFPLPISTAAFKQFIAANDMGIGGEDDAALIKVYSKLSGIKLPDGSNRIS
jgi:3-hydroxyisobutyrate dehydrogenase